MKKRIIALFLVAAMVFSLAACGDTNTGGNGGGKKDDAGNAASKQGVFKIQEIKYDMGEGATDNNINDIRMIDDTIYMVSNTYYNNGYGIYFMTADAQGNMLTKHPIMERTWDNSGDLNGGAVALEHAVSTAKIAVESAAVATEDVMQDIEIPEISEYMDVYSWLILENGQLAYIENHESYNNKTHTSTNTIYYVVCDKDGNEICRANVTENLPEDISFWVNNMIPSAEGTLFLTNYDLILEIDMTGKVLSQIKPTKVTEDIYDVLYYKNGMPVIGVWNEDYTKRSYGVVDIRKGEIIEELALPANLDNYQVYEGGKSGYDLILVNNTGVYGYNTGSTSLDFPLIMDYINSDLATYRVNSVVFTDENTFIAMYNDIIEYDMHMASFVRIPPEEVPDRDTLTLAVYGKGTDLTKAVINFNQTNDQYRITVVDYSQYSTPEDYQAGSTKLNNDIISGKVPDIINCGYNIDVDNFVSKGILVDLYEFMEEDESFNKADYCENVFHAYEVNGKLYQLPIGFYVWTVLGKTSIFGEETSLTWDKLEAIQAQYPESAMFSQMPKTDVLSNALNFVYNDLVDRETGECHFNSEMFKNILEFANTYPETIDWDKVYADENYWKDYQNQYIEDRTLLMQANIYMLYDAWTTSYSTFIEEATPVGFPVMEGMGSNVAATDSYAISAKSKHKDGAWEFVKSFLSEENQLKDERWDYWGLPMLKSALEDSARYMKEKPFYTDAEGNKIEEDFTVWVNDQQVVIEPASDAEVQKWVDFVLSVDRKQPSGYGEALTIISEEAAAYFSGQKTVEAVMDIIQSRMSIYISENQ